MAIQELLGKEEKIMTDLDRFNSATVGIIRPHHASDGAYLDKTITALDVSCKFVAHHLP